MHLFFLAGLTCIGTVSFFVVSAVVFQYFLIVSVRIQVAHNECPAS